MIIKSFDSGRARTAMQQWIESNGMLLPDLNAEDLSLREKILELFNSVKQYKDYQLDVRLGIKLYNYFKECDWFNMRVASNTDFWRYLSICVVPNIVSERWPFDNEDHYWKRPTRIWLRAIWWYIHLTWQDNEQKTMDLLLQPRNFSTDTILNLVERTGRMGTNIEVYRHLIYMYSQITESQYKDFYRRTGNDLFRSIMSLNTIRSLVVEPALCDGGIKGYVTELFKILKVPIYIQDHESDATELYIG